MTDTKDCFYGVPGARFIWHGTNSDPEIEYKNHIVNYYLIEDSLWESYSAICRESGIEAENEAFITWVSENHNEVYEYLDMAIGEYDE